MKIEILGGGCPNCTKLEANTREALNMGGLAAEIEKVQDWDKIIEYGVLSTPALVVDGTVKSSGKALTAQEVLSLLT